MTTLLSARDLTKSYPSSTLFDGIAIHINEGERLGIIGPNGAGKSTLLKILADMDKPDEGEIIRRRGLKLVYVAQDDRFPDGATPLSAVTAVLSHDQAPRMKVETRGVITLSKLGFVNFDRPVAALSGGWRKRLSIACALSHDPDVLMLDEPTNHLDLEGVLWLEAFVRKAPMAMVFVTHDRKFLENTANRILELSSAYPDGTFEVMGNYTEFARRKASFLDAQIKAESALANRVRRDTAWLLQGVQGRQTRNKTQVVAAIDRRTDLKTTKDRNAVPTRATTIDFQATDRKTNKLLELHNVSKSMGDKQLFESLELMLTPGQRIGLLGMNGAGKTTLLRLMAGELEPDSGTIKRAADLRMVTFSQNRDALVANQTLQEALCPIGDVVNYRGKQIHVTGWAKRFLFEADQLSMFVGNLSGGEQARVFIANLMLKRADVLLLDEPTNDLDISSLEVLEQALFEFPGAIVIVTHDRFMLERIATQYVGLDNAGGAKDFSTYKQWADFRTKTVPSSTSNRRDKRLGAKQPKPKSTTRGHTYKEKREYEGMEGAILEAESEVARLKGEAADPSLVTDHVRAAGVYNALSVAEARVTELYERWAVLAATESRE